MEASVEVDGLGIQTLMLHVHHNLTMTEKHEYKSLKMKMLPNRRTVPRPWYGEWVEGESSRSQAA